MYGIELRSTATSQLLGAKGLHNLAAGGPEQMRDQVGTTYIILDGEDVTVTLSWFDDEWVLLEGGTVEEPGDEFPRVDTRSGSADSAEEDN